MLTEPAPPPAGFTPDVTPERPPAAGGVPWKRVGLLAGIVAAGTMLLLPPPAAMSATAWRTAAVAVLMGCWWITEALPIAATALVPLVLFPVLGILEITPAAAPYANPVIFLFFGGFLLAAAFQRSGLHRRLALALISVMGTRPDRVILGFMVATAAISLWVSNTATVVMVMPLAIPLLELMGGNDRRVVQAFHVPLLLGIAYGASIGGLGTLIGTPPNALLAGFMAETHGVRIGFGEFMLIGLPLVVVALPLSWLLLTRVIYRSTTTPLGDVTRSLDEARRALGPVTRGERIVGAVAALAALAWVFQPLLARVVPGLSDTGIAVFAGLVLFLVRLDDGRPALDWHTAEELPWGILLLFGGGLSLAAAIQGSGLATWIGTALGGIGALPLPVVILIVATVITFLTELTSNTATAAAFLPIVSSVAVGIGADPLQLVVPAALAASCGFMLPVGTPPNAIVFATGHVTIPQMARAGFLLNILLILLVTAVSWWLVMPVLGR